MALTPLHLRAHALVADTLTTRDGRGASRPPFNRSIWCSQEWTRPEAERRMNRTYEGGLTLGTNGVVGDEGRGMGGDGEMAVGVRGAEEGCVGAGGQILGDVNLSRRMLHIMRHYCEIACQHLLVVPKSTLRNSPREFEQWAPDFKIVSLTGSKDERAETIATCLIPQDFEVCITSYTTSASSKVLPQEVLIRVHCDQRYPFPNRVLIPVAWAIVHYRHPVAKELFGLLSFICLEIFVDCSDLDSFLHKDSDSTQVEEEKSKKVVEALHKILQPFLLRRVKPDVE